MTGGAAAAERASGATTSASVWNLLIIGALTLLVVLLAAERSTMETTARGAAPGDRSVDAEEERRVARGAGTAAARGDRMGRASRVQIIHVGKTGGDTEVEFLRGESKATSRRTGQLRGVVEVHVRKVRRARVRSYHAFHRTAPVDHARSSPDSPSR